MRRLIRKSVIAAGCAPLVLGSAIMCASPVVAATQHVTLTGLDVMYQDWNSGLYFSLESPTSDGLATVTITNLSITSGYFTYNDPSGLTNQSPEIGGDTSGTVETTTGTVTFTSTTTGVDNFPQASTVTSVDSVTLNDAFGDAGQESWFFETFQITDPSKRAGTDPPSSISFDVNIDAAGVAADPLNPDFLSVEIDNCNWPPTTLPTDAPNGESVLYVPITSLNPTYQAFTTQPGQGDTSFLPGDTNYPGITAQLTPEPSPLASLIVGMLGIATLLLTVARRRRPS